MAIKIICHMITTLDSRIVTARWDLPEDFDISAVYENTAAKFNAQGWIVGRTTMSEYADNISEHESSLDKFVSRPDYKGAYRDGQQLAVVFDLKGKLAYDGCVLPTGEHVLAVLSPAVSDAYLATLQEQGISYVFTTDDENTMLSEALYRIQAMYPHVSTLLLEGGGTINGSFLKAGLINEISLIVCPLLDGAASVQNFVNYHGDPDPRPGMGQRLELLEQELFAGGTLYLRYQVCRD